ncbi:hypothetical protein FQA47_025565 [Oryzias melastigma]|uniref:Uncharacterized protein n=1 Tax=Oryzias melastigma TaxID=30732 RepID=A0A834CHH0_ORYME|nr:hypothetical protein FQA47_025565 [Oryzias melastigma]
MWERGFKAMLSMSGRVVLPQLPGLVFALRRMSGDFPKLGGGCTPPEPAEEQMF